MNYNYTPRYLKEPGNAVQQDYEAEQKLLDLYLAKRLNKQLNLRLTASNLLDMVKDKKKTSYIGSQISNLTHETEKGGRAFNIVLEASW